MAKKKSVASSSVVSNARMVAMSCIYGKPSPIKSDGESVDSVRITLRVPESDLSPATAEELFVWQRLTIEFGRLKLADWKQKVLPGTDSPDVFKCVAEVSGFKRSRTHRTWSFIANTDTVSVDEALDLWKCDGSVRVTAMGVPGEKKTESTAPDPNQKSLLD